jgi:autotransporter adhesin
VHKNKTCNLISKKFTISFVVTCVATIGLSMLPFGMANAQTSPNAYSCDLSSGDSSSNGGNNVDANNRKDALACGIFNRVRPASPDVDGDGNMAFGMYNNVSGNGYVVVMGYENNAGGTRNVLVGTRNTAGAMFLNSSTGTGPVIHVPANGATIIGQGNTAQANRAVVIGSANVVVLSWQSVDDVSPTGGIAIGEDNGVTGIESIAIGHRATVGFDNSQSIVAPLFPANYAIAIGADTRAELHHSVAIGSNSTAVAAHQGAFTINGGNIAATSAPGSVFSVGKAGFERQVQNVAAGVVSATSTDAVNGSQLYAVGTQVNRNTANISSLSTDVFDLQNMVNQNSADIDDLSQQALSGVALAMSMGGAVLPPGKDSAVSVGVGTYKGEQAFSASALFLVNPNLILSGGVGITSSDSNVGARVGLTFGW